MRLPPRPPCAQSILLKPPIQVSIQTMAMHLTWRRWARGRAAPAVQARHRALVCSTISWVLRGALQGSGAPRLVISSPFLPYAIQPAYAPIMWLQLHLRFLGVPDGKASARLQIPSSEPVTEERWTRLQQPTNAQSGRHFHKKAGLLSAP